MRSLTRINLQNKMYIDASIYDDPNIFVGGQNQNNSYREDKKRIKSVFDKFPANGTSNKEAESILGDWLVSADYRIWEEDFLYFHSLSDDNYIRLIAQFPDLFLEKIPCRSEKVYAVYRQMKSFYSAVATWLLPIMRYDRSNPPILTTAAYQIYEPYADIKKARLELCQALMKNSFEDFYSRIFPNAVSLFFWWEVSECKANIEFNGLIKPVEIENILGKEKIGNTWLDISAAISDSVNAERLGSIEIRGIEGNFTNLHSTILHKCREIADLDSSFQDGALKTYESVFRASTRKMRRSKDYQAIYCYSQDGKQEVFVTGQNLKLPCAN